MGLKIRAPRPYRIVFVILITTIVFSGCTLDETSTVQPQSSTKQAASPSSKQVDSTGKHGEVSPNGVKTLEPEGAIEATGTWNVGVRAGDFVYVAGMRGIDPETNTLVEDPKERIRQAFMNMKVIAESEGAGLRDATRLVVYVTDMYRYRPMVNEIQEELWGSGPYPPRTIVEVDRMNQDDIFEVEGTFYAPVEDQMDSTEERNTEKEEGVDDAT